MAATSADAAVDQLIEVVSPPTTDQRAIDWNQVEPELGTPVPRDYRRICELYGPGQFDGTLMLAFPRRGYPLDLVGYSAAVAQMHRDKRETVFSSEDPGLFPVFPESEGALAWGRTDTSLTLVWRTTGDPDQWTVAIVDDDSAYPEFWEYVGGAAQFLLDVVSGALVVPILDETGYGPAGGPRFESLG